MPTVPELTNFKSAPQADRGWRRALKLAWRTPAQLLEELQLSPQLLDDIETGQREFPLLAPTAFVQQIEKGNRQDPLFLQIFPSAAEAIPGPGLLSDPVGDLNSQVVPGLLHKYRSRALLISTGACAIHCRYCFRRHFPYSSATGLRHDWQKIQEYIDQHPAINEIILSGGDPLMLATGHLEEMTRRLEKLPQIKTLRIHSRMLTTLPERLDNELIEWLSRLNLKLVFVHHINHPKEIGPAASNAIKLLDKFCHQQLNQSVLLAGVNNNIRTLCLLSETLFTNNIMPYYLHQMDPVQAAGHFICDDKQATELVAQMRAQLPGYLVPVLVRQLARHLDLIHSLVPLL